MTLTVQLTPQTEASLLAQARAQGVPLDVYVQSVVEETALPSAPAISDEEFEAALDELAEGSENLPILPPEAYTRQGIYGSD